MRGRSASQSYDAESHSSFGHRQSEQEHAFDLRDPYKLNRAPLLRGGKRRLSGLPSYAAVVISAVALVGLGVYIGRELVRPPQRPWEGSYVHHPPTISVTFKTYLVRPHRQSCFLEFGFFLQRNLYSLPFWFPFAETPFYFLPMTSTSCLAICLCSDGDCGRGTFTHIVRCELCRF